MALEETCPMFSTHSDAMRSPSHATHEIVNLDELGLRFQPGSLARRHANALLLSLDALSLLLKALGVSQHGAV
eukprot:6181535-Pleurochrysis_carterae.AAC.1